MVDIRAEYMRVFAAAYTLKPCCNLANAVLKPCRRGNHEDRLMNEKYGFKRSGTQGSQRAYWEQRSLLACHISSKQFLRIFSILWVSSYFR